MEVERKKGDRQIWGKAMDVTFAADYEASTRLVCKHSRIQAHTTCVGQRLQITLLFPPNLRKNLARRDRGFSIRGFLTKGREQSQEKTQGQKRVVTLRSNISRVLRTSRGAMAIAAATASAVLPHAAAWYE